MAGDDPRVGHVIEGRFRVIRFLGRGGMGAVYEGEHVELGKRVAIKFMHREGLEQEAMERFRREARAASRVSHPNVIQIYDAGTVEALDEMYIVMELVEGAADLRTVVAREGALAPARALAIATALLEGLHAIHEAGIVHRDIKPANVLVLADGAGVKIMDFGISKSVSTSTRLTQTGRVLGSPQFMAPEQILGGPIDRRADLYAVGVTLYQILVGAVPFTELEYTKLVVRHLRAEAPSLAIARPGTPPAIVDAVARVLQKDPAARYPTALAFAAALRRRASSVPPPPAAKPTVALRKRSRRPSQPPPSHRTAWLVAGAIAAAGAIALGLALTMHHATPIAAAAMAPLAPAHASSSPPPTPSPAVPLAIAIVPVDPPPPPRPQPVARVTAQPIAPPAESGSASGSGSDVKWMPVATEVPLELASIPTGAHAWLDGVAVGEAPVRLEHVAVGKHLVHFALVGYQSEDVTVTIFSTQDVAYAQARLQLLVNPHADHRLNPY